MPSSRMCFLMQRSKSSSGTASSSSFSVYGCVRYRQLKPDLSFSWPMRLICLAFLRKRSPIGIGLTFLKLRVSGKSGCCTILKRWLPKLGWKIGDCIKWIHEAVELLPGHKRLVLFSTKVTYKINDTIKEKARPTDEVINRVAKAKGPPTIIFPIGWAHEFFAKLPENPLQKLFPDCQPLEKFVIRDENRKKKILTLPAVSVETESKQFFDLEFPDRVGNVTQYLGLVSPIIRLSSVMENSSPEYEEYLIRTWLDMRSSPWQWFSSNLINGKMIVGDLNIDKKARIWTLDLCEYSSSADFLAILGSSGSDKSNNRK